MRKAEINNTVGAILTITVFISLFLFVFKERWSIPYVWVFSPIWAYIGLCIGFFLFSIIYNFFKYRKHINHGRNIDN